jgi:gentisate 1,2-dioxygenase
MSKQIDERDRRIGRAFVDDDEKLQAYYRELERHETGALWTVANDIEPWEPVAHSVPMIWRHADLREPVLRSLDLVSPEKAGRRVVYLRNPRRKEVSACCGWLFSGIQAMRPGEAPSHRTPPRRCALSWRVPAPPIVNGHKLTSACAISSSLADMARSWRRRGRRNLDVAGRARHTARQCARANCYAVIPTVPKSTIR